MIKVTSGIVYSQQVATGSQRNKASLQTNLGRWTCCVLPGDVRAGKRSYWSIQQITVWSNAVFWSGASTIMSAFCFRITLIMLQWCHRGSSQIDNSNYAVTNRWASTGPHGQNEKTLFLGGNWGSSGQSSTRTRKQKVTTCRPLLNRFQPFPSCNLSQLSQLYGAALNHWSAALGNYKTREMRVLPMNTTSQNKGQISLHGYDDPCCSKLYMQMRSKIM